MSQILTRMYQDMVDFVNNTGDTLQKMADNMSGKSDNPDDYLPQHNMTMIENMFLHAPNVASNLVTIGEKFKKYEHDETRTKNLADIYSQTLNLMVK